MASGKVVGVVIDDKMLEEAALQNKGVTFAVNEQARRIKDTVNSMSRGFKTARFYGRPNKSGAVASGTFTGTRGPVKESWMRGKSGVVMVGGKTPIYLYKPATFRSNPHALVYTGNYAAMQFELQNNGLMKASR